MKNGEPRRFHPVYLLLLLPYAAFFAVPFYNRITPELLGIPFFHWWQVLWVIGTALCILPVYLHEEKRRK
jgi:hypothetical protein